ncbi:MAG TPA: LLM class F420-dependent oxidoreductase [Polyangia bacterium]|nr:LLM class F420-dependent oxidoreductase [Polyangia bacterium]
MRYGVTTFLTDRSIGPAELARAAEERGLDSLYVPEHTHIPVSRRTPWPAGGELPDEYRRTLDPFVALTAAAAVTTRLLVGTGVCLVAQRDPIITAKEVATLDLISRGRFVFGVGIGWNQDEAEHHRVDFKHRRSQAREHVLVMQRLWSDEVAAFDGKFARLEPSWAWPKPVQRPRPPIIVGGAATPALFAHIAEWADGWLPIGGAGVGAALPELRAAFERAGRDPASARVVIYGVLPDAGKLAHYRELGVDEVVFGAPSGNAELLLPILDHYATLAGK